MIRLGSQFGSPTKMCKTSGIRMNERKENCDWLNSRNEWPNQISMLSVFLQKLRMSFRVNFGILLLVYRLTLIGTESNEGNEGFCLLEDKTCNEKNDNLMDGEQDIFDNLTRTKIRSALTNFSECSYSNCSCYLDVLRSDLEPFKEGITREMIESVKPRGTTYVVLGKKLYRNRECMFPARCSGIEHFLKKLLPKLKDTELVINTRDWPQVSKHFRIFGPVFSFSKTKDYLDVMYPAWSFWEGGPAIKIYPTGLGRWDLHRKSLTEESLKWPWDKKIGIGFFRGSRTSDQRDNVVLLSRKRRDLVDAQYTKNQAWKSSEDTLGEQPAEVVPLEYHCKFKYLFNFQGVAASFRFKHLFLCGSLVIHVGDEWQEFFYSSLKPWVHYVPLEPNASEQTIMRLIKFLQNNDKMAQEIAERGFKFISEHLSLKEVKCYWKTLLNDYTKLINFSVTVDNNFIQIK